MEAFVGQLLIVPFNFAPRGWAFAAGQLMPISQNTALFSLIGTYYGGDGKSTFALPNMQGNVAIGSGQGGGLSLYDLGQEGGSQTVTLVDSEMPNHNHVLQGAAGRGVNADSQSANGNSLAPTQGAAGTPYLNGTAPNQQLAYQAVAMSGGSQPHNNMMPFLALNYIIALQGVFPPRS